MISLADKDKCTGCAACEQSCSVGAVKMAEDKEGFLFPVVDKGLDKLSAKFKRTA